MSQFNINMQKLQQSRKESKHFQLASKSAFQNTLIPPIKRFDKMRANNSLFHHKKACLQNDLGDQAENADETSATANFDRMNQQISKEIGFYIKWVDKFQATVRPFYETIYLKTRKKLFDFFGKEIDVISLGLQIGVVNHQPVHALVRSQRRSLVQVKTADG